MDGTLRYDHHPVLQSVFAYGSETHVPDHDICRLSYYVKCCVVGCGIRMPLADDALLDYMTAHMLPTHLQELIKRMAFQELSLDRLLNSALILDEHHTLLPFGTLNTFYEFKTASTYFTINSLTVGSGRQECVHKVMLWSFPLPGNSWDLLYPTLHKSLLQRQEVMRKINDKINSKTSKRPPYPAPLALPVAIEQRAM